MNLHEGEFTRGETVMQPTINVDTQYIMRGRDVQLQPMRSRSYRSFFILEGVPVRVRQSCASYV